MQQPKDSVLPLKALPGRKRSQLKYWLKRILILLPFLPSSALADPAVWTASKAGVEFTLLGSIHVGDNDMLAFPSPVAQRWPGYNGLVVEANILDAEIDIQPGHTATRDLLGAQQQSKLKAIADQLGLSYTALNNSAPWQVAMSLQVAMTQRAGLSSQHGIDTQLLERAVKDGKPIYELEGVNYQINLLANMESSGLPLLTTTLDNWDEMESSLQCLLDAWKAGDTETLRTLSSDSFDDPALEALLLTNRNKNWVSQLTNSGLYPPGKYLVVAGALHLVGDTGLPTLLKNAGYTLVRENQPRAVTCQQSK
ncbi:TraB/GumN family protein [Parasalinivibrio latis]|uniref:TraB/GumN family protein n=1 Tax=Parasalinivibrio latis TaxID=2952610 RepID=UPI0030E39F7B